MPKVKLGVSDSDMTQHSRGWGGSQTRGFKVLPQGEMLTMCKDVYIYLAFQLSKTPSHALFRAEK